MWLHLMCGKRGKAKKRKGPYYFNTQTGELGGPSCPGKQRCTVAAYVRTQHSSLHTAIILTSLLRGRRGDAGAGAGGVGGGARVRHRPWQTRCGLMRMLEGRAEALEGTFSAQAVANMLRAMCVMQVRRW
jgi:hypothetical protein